MKDWILTASSVFRGNIEYDTPKYQGYHKRTSAEDIDICLTCTKSKCFGGDKCFRERKRKVEKEAGR